jgi:hypothetical protein
MKTAGKRRKMLNRLRSWAIRDCLEKAIVDPVQSKKQTGARLAREVCRAKSFQQKQVTQRRARLMPLAVVVVTEQTELGAGRHDGEQSPCQIAAAGVAAATGWWVRSLGSRLVCTGCMFYHPVILRRYLLLADRLDQVGDVRDSGAVVVMKDPSLASQYPLCPHSHSAHLARPCPPGCHPTRSHPCPLGGAVCSTCYPSPGARACSCHFPERLRCCVYCHRLRRASSTEGELLPVVLRPQSMARDTAKETPALVRYLPASFRFP